MQMRDAIPILIILLLACLILPLSIWGTRALWQSPIKSIGKQIKKGNLLLQRVASLIGGLYLPSKPDEGLPSGSIPMSGKVLLEEDGFQVTLTFEQDPELTYYGAALFFVTPPKQREASIPIFQKRFFFFQEPNVSDDAFLPRNLEGLTNDSIPEEVKQPLLELVEQAWTFQYKKGELQWSSKRTFYETNKNPQIQAEWLGQKFRQLLLVTKALQKEAVYEKILTK